MGGIPGAVTPFRTIKMIKKVKSEIFIDKRICKNGTLIAVHPNDNTATVYLKAEDFN